LRNLLVAPSTVSAVALILACNHFWWLIFTHHHLYLDIRLQPDGAVKKTLV